MTRARINKDAFFEHKSCFLGKTQDLCPGLDSQNTSLFSDVLASGLEWLPHMRGLSSTPLNNIGARSRRTLSNQTPCFLDQLCLKKVSKKEIPTSLPLNVRNIARGALKFSVKLRMGFRINPSVSS